MHTIKLFKKKYRTVLIFTTAAALSLLACFVFAFDSQSGYFTSGLLPAVFYLICGAGALAALLSLLNHSEFEILETPDEIDAKSRPFFVAAGIAITLLAGIALSIPYSFLDPGIILNGTLGTLCFGFYIIATVIKGYKFKILRLSLLFVSILLPVTLGLGNGTNYTRHINSVENTLSAVFSISFLLYILYEARRSCQGKHSVWHFISMLWTMLSGASLSIAYIIAYMLDRVNEGYRFYQMLVIFCISGFMMIELNRFVRTLTPQTTFKAHRKEQTQTDTQSEQSAQEEPDEQSKTNARSEATTEK